jgi:hypothetical protein
MNVITKREYHFTEEEMKEFVVSLIRVQLIHYTPKNEVEAEYRDTISNVMEHLRNGNHSLDLED